jgi:flagellar motility protein MotE (MotC chaperone)
MIKLIVKLGKWLETRFPEKLYVTAESYEQIHTELSMLRGQMQEAEQSLAKALERLSVVESNAVHKDAVKDLVEVVKAVKLEYSSLKASMGFTPIKDEEIRAMLNGEQI